MATEMLWMLGGLVLAMFLVLSLVRMESHRSGRRHSTKPLFRGLVLAGVVAVAVLVHVLARS